MRHPGNYWVRFQGSTLWQIAYWFDDDWFIFNRISSLQDSDFDEIDENRIERKPPNITDQLENIANNWLK